MMITEYFQFSFFKSARVCTKKVCEKSFFTFEFLRGLLI